MKKLKTLTPKLKKKALNAAVRKGANVWRDAARSKALQLDDPETASKISKEIATAYSGRESKKVGGSVMRVGVRGGAKPVKGNTDTGHWRLLEFGTEKMAAQPFMRQAQSENIDKTIVTVATNLDKSIDKIIASGVA